MSTTTSVYRGHPAKQKNPTAENAFVHKASKPNARPVRHQGLPPPSNLTEPSNKDLKDTPPNTDAVFSRHTQSHEKSTQSLFTPQFAGFNALVDKMMVSYYAQYPTANKIISPGMINYYASCMCWFRILSLKQKNARPFNEIERRIWELLQTASFEIPKPLAIYLNQFGNIVTKSLQNLEPDFPAYPTNQGNAVWSAQVNEATHAYYESYPTVGVAAECLQQETLPQADPNWQPTVVPPNTHATTNMLSYTPPVPQREEIQTLLTTAGVTPAQFRETIPDSRINMPLLDAISRAITRIGVYKNETTYFPQTEANGDQSQLVKIIPTPSDTLENVNSYVRISEYALETSGTVGKAITFVPNLLKEGTIADDHYKGWSCLENEVPDNPVVQAGWYANRNDLRNIPRQYEVELFTTASRNAAQFREGVLFELSHQE